MASDTIPDRMVISLANKDALYKGDLMMLEMIAQCDWKRPIYVALTVGEDNYMNLGDNFVQEGLANRITPFTTNKPGAKRYDTEKVYNNLMNRYKFGGLSKPGLYLDETVIRMCYTHRNLYAELANRLIAEGQKQKALKVLEKVDKEIPSYNVPYSASYNGSYLYAIGALDLARAYALLGKKQQSMTIMNDVWKHSNQLMEWYLSLNADRFAQSMSECLREMTIMRQIADDAPMVDKKLAGKWNNMFNTVFARYRAKGGILPNRD